MISTAGHAMRRVENVMGTTVSIDVEPPLVSTGDLDEVFEQLHDIDARFSTYKPDSEISRLMRGELREEDASLDVRHVLAACDHLAIVTGGAFDARPPPPGRAARPVGLRQGLGDRGGRLADRQRRRPQLLDQRRRRHRGARRGRARPAVAGRDPPPRPGRSRGRRPGRLRPSRRDLGRLRARRAHQGSADGTGSLATGLRSVTVVGPGLAFTDAYATAVYAMGLDGLGWLAADPDRAPLRRLRHHRRRPRGLDRGDGALPGPRRL